MAEQQGRRPVQRLVPKGFHTEARRLLLWSPNSTLGSTPQAATQSTRPGKRCSVSHSWSSKNRLEYAPSNPPNTGPTNAVAAIPKNALEQRLQSIRRSLRCMLRTWAKPKASPAEHISSGRWPRTYRTHWRRYMPPTLSTAWLREGMVGTSFGRENGMSRSVRQDVQATARDIWGYLSTHGNGLTLAHSEADGGKK